MDSSSKLGLGRTFFKVWAGSGSRLLVFIEMKPCPTPSSLEPVGPVWTRQVQGLGLGLARSLQFSSDRALARFLNRWTRLSSGLGRTFFVSRQSREGIGPPRNTPEKPLRLQEGHWSSAALGTPAEGAG